MDLIKVCAAGNNGRILLCGGIPKSLNNYHKTRAVGPKTTQLTHAKTLMRELTAAP